MVDAEFDAFEDQLLINAVGGAPVPAKNAEAFRQLAHVTVASPVIQNFSLGGGAPEIIYGIDYESYNALRPFVFLEGGPFKNPDDVIVDDVFAHTDKGYHIGDTIKILNHPFHICGIVENGKGGRKMIDIGELGALMGSEGKASLFFLKTDDESNQELVAMQREVDAIIGDTLECYDDGAVEEEELAAFGLVLELFNHAIDERRAALQAGTLEPARVAAIGSSPTSRR